MNNKHITEAENAERFADWIKYRGGVAVWRSANLANPGKSWCSPAQTKGQPTTKPSWESEDKPARIITDENDILIAVDRELERFHVAVRMGANGLMLKLTDASARKLKSKLESAAAIYTKDGVGPYYRFDYGSEENCVIMVPDKVMPLPEYLKTKENDQKEGVGGAQS